LYVQRISAMILIVNVQEKMNELTQLRNLVWTIINTEAMEIFGG